MKLIIILITVFSCGIITAQTPLSFKEIKYSHLNEEGKSISKDDFLTVVRDKSKNYFSWSFFANDTSIVRKLVNVNDERKQVSYPSFVKKLEEITGRRFPGSPVILLNYRSLNDICSHKLEVNTWDRFRIRSDKRYSNELVKIAKEHYENVIILHFYEEGIIIKPSKIMSKYFHIDKGNFLKNNLFTNSVICGASAAIMPGGMTLIRHSEGSPSKLAKAILPEKWKEIFETE